MKALLVLIAAALLVGCISTIRTSMPREESHYARTVAHELGRGVAVQRVEQALGESFTDQPKALTAIDRAKGTFLLEPTVIYKVGGPMGEVQHARYRLEVVVRDVEVTLVFDLGPDVDSGAWAPKSELPYIYRSFDAVVTNVEEALTEP